MKTRWYYQVMGDVCGPVTAEELRRLAQTNAIGLDSFVRRESGDWVTADRIGGLFPWSAASSDGEPQNGVYYQVMGEVRGPVGRDALKRLAQTNNINRDTFVRLDGEEWVSADQVCGLLD